MKRVDLSDAKTLRGLSAGESVLLSGKTFTGRDAAHKKLFNLLKNGDKLPFELKDASIFYVGPCFDEKGGVIAAGPTTSMRMDAYAPTLYDAGIAVTIGKGDRSKQVYDSLVRNGAVYFAAIGGAGAIYGEAVKSCRQIAYPELGTEAVYLFEIEDFPVIVAIDAEGRSIYDRT